MPNRASALIIAFILLSSFGFLLISSNNVSASPTIIYEDDFESGISKWDNAYPANIYISTDQKHGGTSSLLILSGGDSYQESHTLATAQTFPLQYDFWFYVDSSGLADNSKILFTMGDNADGWPCGPAIGVLRSGTDYTIISRYYNSGWYSDWVCAFTLESWHHIFVNASSPASHTIYYDNVKQGTTWVGSDVAGTPDSIKTLRCLYNTGAVGAYVDDWILETGADNPSAGSWKPTITNSPATTSLAYVNYTYVPTCNETFSFTGNLKPSWATWLSNGLYGYPPVGLYDFNISCQSTLGGGITYLEWSLNVTVDISDWLVEEEDSDLPNYRTTSFGMNTFYLCKPWIMTVYSIINGKVTEMFGGEYTPPDTMSSNWEVRNVKMGINDRAFILFTFQHYVIYKWNYTTDEWDNFLEVNKYQDEGNLRVITFLEGTEWLVSYRDSTDTYSWIDYVKYEPYWNNATYDLLGNKLTGINRSANINITNTHYLITIDYITTSINFAGPLVSTVGRGFFVYAYFNDSIGKAVVFAFNLNTTLYESNWVGHRELYFDDDAYVSYDASIPSDVQIFAPNGITLIVSVYNGTVNITYVVGVAWLEYDPTSHSSFPFIVRPQATYNHYHIGPLMESSKAYSLVNENLFDVLLYDGRIIQFQLDSSALRYTLTTLEYNSSWFHGYNYRLFQTWKYLGIEYYTRNGTPGNYLYEGHIQFVEILYPVISGDFIGSPRIGKEPLLVTFTYISTGDPLAQPTNITWDANNDGNIDGYGTRYVHNYTTNGTYTVVCKVSNPSMNGEYTITKANYIRVTFDTSNYVPYEVIEINFNALLWLLMTFLPALILATKFGRFGFLLGLVMMATIFAFSTEGYTFVAVVVYVGVAALIYKDR